MRRLALIGFFAALLFSMQLLLNCANPLEFDKNSQNDPNKPDNDTILRVDTLIFYDTVFNNDTLLIVDTSVVYDTVFLPDSLYGIDTIIIYDTIINLDSIIIIDTVGTTDSSFIIDTILIIDTIYNNDSAFIFDTVYIIDSIITTDTVIIEDTVSGVDTIFIIDTIIEEDSIFIIDTIINTDTLINTDTITIIDTVIVEQPDTSTTHYVCTQLSSSQQYILWMLRNAEGNYHLVFEANIEKDHPDRNVIVEIDGQPYEWNLNSSLKFIIDCHLSENSKIRIISEKPSAFGHPADICLNIDKIE